jgi:hypothetical protein
VLEEKFQEIVCRDFCAYIQEGCHDACLEPARLLCLIAVYGAPAWPQSGADSKANEGTRFCYKKTPEGDLDVYMDYPRSWKAKDNRPAIIFFSGGAWNARSVESFHKTALYLAGRGMVAARADYRVKKRHGVTPGKCVEDARTAVRWLRMNAQKLDIDPNRIVAYGGSAGRAYYRLHRDPPGRPIPAPTMFAAPVRRTRWFSSPPRWIWWA